MLNIVSEVVSGVPIIVQENKEREYRDYLYKIMNDLNLLQIYNGGIQAWLSFYMDSTVCVFLCGVMLYLYFFSSQFSGIAAIC